MKSRNLLQYVQGGVIILASCMCRPAQADDITPPSSVVKLLFIHHSTGGNWLADPTPDYPSGGLAIALKNNNYYVSATNYGWGPDAIGDRTDIPNWPEWFTGPNHNTILNAVFLEHDKNVGDFGDWSRLAVNPGGENEVIMFKSCFPNSDLYGEAADAASAEPNDWEYSVANAKAVYTRILTYFNQRQNKLFVVITAPPLNQGEYLSGDQPVAKRAANARAFNNWLVKDWLKNYTHQNVAVFDYYNVLTSNGGNADVNDVNQASGNHHRWWQNAVQHVQPINNNYAAYPSGDSHPSSAGHRKATQEFLPLLNAFYHRWKSGTKVESCSQQPQQFHIHHAYPNPFNAQIIITFTVNAHENAQAIIYNSRGERIVGLGPVRKAGDVLYFYWQGQNESGNAAASGVYFYQIITGTEQFTGKILLAK